MVAGGLSHGKTQDIGTLTSEETLKLVPAQISLVFGKPGFSEKGLIKMSPRLLLGI